MVAQRNVAEDITEQIPTIDIEFAQQTVSDCLADRTPGKISEYSASAWRGGQLLHIMYASARQIVSGQSSPVHLMMLESLSETDVETIVDVLRKQLAEHPDIASTDGDIRFSRIHASERGYQYSFIHGRAIFNAMFIYDGDEVRLDSVELRHRWNEDGTVTEF